MAKHGITRVHWAVSGENWETISLKWLLVAKELKGFVNWAALLCFSTKTLC